MSKKSTAPTKTALTYQQEQDAASTRRGSFVLRLTSGKKFRFKDAESRGRASEHLSRNRFNGVGDMVKYLETAPNGRTRFAEKTTPWKNN